MFAGANSMTTSTTNQAYHLADNIAGFTDKELQHIITVIAGWPGDSGGSESLSKILHGLDYAAAGRCPLDPFPSSTSCNTFSLSPTGQKTRTLFLTVSRALTAWKLWRLPLTRVSSSSARPRLLSSPG